MSTPLATTNTGSSHAARPSDDIAGIFDTLRGHVRRVVPAARGVIGRVGDRIESFIGPKIKRRVKPPIVIAIVVAGLALAAAVVALIRK